MRLSASKKTLDCGELCGGFGGVYCVEASTIRRTAGGSTIATAGIAESNAAPDPSAVLVQEADDVYFGEESGWNCGVARPECEACDRANACRFGPL